MLNRLFNYYSEKNKSLEEINDETVVVTVTDAPFVVVVLTTVAAIVVVIIAVFPRRRHTLRHWHSDLRFDLTAVQLMKRCFNVLGNLVVFVPHEAEPSQVTSGAVAHDDTVEHGPEATKVIAQRLLVRLPGKAADEDFSCWCGVVVVVVDGVGGAVVAAVVADEVTVVLMIVT